LKTEDKEAVEAEEVKEEGKKKKNSCLNFKKYEKQSLKKQLIYPGMQHQVIECKAILLT